MSRRLLLGVGTLGIVVMIVGLWPVFERVFGRKRLRFPYLAQPIAAETYAALASKPGWSKADVEVAAGVRLRGLVRKPKGSSAPWVLFYPGNDASQLERGQAFLSQLGGELDWGLAVFPYRGYDASDGKPALADIAADAPRILQELCRTFELQPGQVHLAGFSIGGHFAVRAAGGAAQQGRRAASLTLLAPVNDIVMYYPSPWEKLTSGEDYQTAPYLSAVPAPVLVLQGGADQTLDGPGQGHAIARQLGDKARYEEMPGVDHVPLLFDEATLEHARAFIRQHAAK